jgi:hypothetical protein
VHQDEQVAGRSASLAGRALGSEFDASTVADTGWYPEPSDWTPAERELRERFEADRYANPAWNEKR